FTATAGAANVDGLSRYYGSNRLAHVHRVCVHHPSHDLFVGIYIRGGDVFLRADEFNQFSGVAPCHALELAHRHLVRIANDTALGASKRDIDHSAFPGHPAGQRAYFIERHIRRVADSAFGRTARDRMLYPKAGENFKMAIVHLYRYVDSEFAVGITQHAPQSLAQVELLSGQIKTRALGFPWIAFFVHVEVGGYRAHKAKVSGDQGDSGAG